MTPCQPPYITCPVCGMTSYHSCDVVYRYCGHCDRFHKDMDDAEIRRATGDRRAAEEFGRTRLGRFIRWLGLQG